jgi:hypothetical protein
MKTFFYMGHNRKNVSGVSWKIWKIERKGRKVTFWWGPATIFRRKPIPTSTLQKMEWRLSTEEKAIEVEGLRIEEKLRGGYKRSARRKPTRRA